MTTYHVSAAFSRNPAVFLRSILKRWMGQYIKDTQHKPKVHDAITALMVNAAELLLHVGGGTHEQDKFMDRLLQDFPRMVEEARRGEDPADGRINT